MEGGQGEVGRKCIGSARLFPCGFAPGVVEWTCAVPSAAAIGTEAHTGCPSPLNHTDIRETDGETRPRKNKINIFIPVKKALYAFC